MFYKAVITSKGLALDAKIKAGQTTAAFTRVKLGDGTYDGQEDLKGAANLKNTRNEFGISSIKVIDENTVRIRIVTNNSSLNSGYYISELALFATDPDEGEILYSISLGVPGKMDYQPSKTEMLNATATIDILTSISDAETANIQTGTGAAASAEDLAELETRIKGVETPEFDASGSVDGITGKTTLLASFVSKMPLIKFMRNVKAGFKLVSFVGDIVNNCVTDNANLPLSAAQGKKLMDLYTVLNTKITQKSQSEFYTIADVTGVSTGQVTDGYHNVSKMSNGQFRYSAHFTCYPSAIPNGNIVGYLPESANPYQIVYEYTYDITNQKWVRIRIGNNDRSIQLMNLDGTNVTSQRVELEYHIDF